MKKCNWYSYTLYVPAENEAIRNTQLPAVLRTEPPPRSQSVRSALEFFYAAGPAAVTLLRITQHRIYI